MKKFMTLLICTLISIVIVVVMPMLFHTFSFVRVESESTNHVGMFHQTVESVNAKEQTSSTTKTRLLVSFLIRKL